MSVVAVTVYDDFLVIGGDGVFYEPHNGNVMGAMSKLELMPDLDCVLGITGIGGFGHIMRWMMPKHVRDFDGLVDCLPDLVVRTLLEMAAGGMLKFDYAKVCVVAAGWSEREKKCQAFRVVSHEKAGIDAATLQETILAPWTLHALPSGVLWRNAGSHAEIDARFGLHLATEGADVAEPVIRAICATRASSGPMEQDDQVAIFNAGVFCQVAVLQRSMVQSWIAHRWPEDVVGEPIDPTRGRPLPDHLPMAETDAPA